MKRFHLWKLQTRRSFTDKQSMAPVVEEYAPIEARQKARALLRRLALSMLLTIFAATPSKTR